MSTTAKRDDPKLWNKVKREITTGDKGGNEGEWSARKAQLAVAAYKKAGGGYLGKKSKDNNLTEWTQEDWGTRSGKPSGDTGERYLPKKAREALSKSEYDRTTSKKRKDTAEGKQFSAQPDDVARKTAPYRGGKAEPTKSELMQEARKRNIPGRSKMNKSQLEDALSN